MRQPARLLRCLAIACLMSSPGYAQQWDVKLTDGLHDAAVQSVQQTQDGGYIVAAWVKPTGTNYDIGVLKLDANGVPVWQKAYGGPGDDRPYAIRQTTDSGFILTGLTASFATGGPNDSDVWVLKLSPSGTIDWQKRYDGGNFGSWDTASGGSFIDETVDGGYIVQGQIGTSDVWLLKLFPDGAIDWQKTYAWQGHDPVHSIHQTADNGYILAGPASDNSLRVVKLYSDGNIQWQRAYPAALTGFHAFSSIRQTADLGYIVAATTSMGAGDLDVWVLKLDPYGTPVWQRTYGGASTERSHSILETSDGGYIVAATACSFATNCGELDSDIWLLKLDGNGTVLWEKIRRGILNIHASSALDLTDDGGYVVGGRTLSPGVTTHPDMVVLKVDGNGGIPDLTCSSIGDSDATVTVTSVESMAVDIAVGETSVEPIDTDAVPEDVSYQPVVYCHAQPVNQPPAMTVNATTIATDEGDLAINGGSVTDPDGDTIMLTASAGMVTSNDNGVWSWSLPTDNGPADSQTVTVTADDGHGGIAAVMFELTVNNVAPTVQDISVPLDPVSIDDQPVVAEAEFVDPGAPYESYTCEVDYNDGTGPQPGTVVWRDTPGDQTQASVCQGPDHIYAQPGVYKVTVTVTDEDGGTGNRMAIDLIVIYDADAGFVTGGGWIYSEPGWCLLDALCAAVQGKANFGFVSKYMKRPGVPEGHTEFNFSTGGLNFHSDTYEWLVINEAGTSAHFRGSGTIDGALAENEEAYKFMIWAKDLDPDSLDTFRIKIWFEQDGAETVVYDNGFDQNIGGGNIRVHVRK